jgi:hypothetical protein
MYTASLSPVQWRTGALVAHSPQRTLPMKFTALHVLFGSGILAAACSGPDTTPTLDAGTDAGAGDSGMTPTCPAPPSNIVKHTGNTAAGVTEVWKAAEGIHLQASDRSIYGTLVIEPCAEVRLGDDVTLSLWDNGILKIGAQGGGLVTVDAENPAKPWHVLYSVKPTTRMEITNAVLKNGGNTGPNGGGAIYVRGAGLRGEPPTSTVLLVDNVRVENSATYGIQIDSNGAFDPASKNLTITGSKKSPIALFAKAMGSIPTGLYTGNTNDWFQVDGGGTGKEVIDADTTWVDRGLPIVPPGGLRIEKNQGNAALTVEAGVVVQMREPTAYKITVGSSQKSPEGALIVLGTAAKPVTFRGRGKANDWAGIGFYGAVDPRSHFDHVVIEDVGGDDSTIGLECLTVDSLPKPADAGSGGIRFFIPNEDDVLLREDFLRNSTIRRSGSNGVLPNFHPGNGLNFCTGNNVFEDIALCGQTPFPVFTSGTKNLTCAKPVQCACK